MSDQFAPQNYYDTLTGLYTTLFGNNWHLGYWLNAANFEQAGRRLNELMIARLPVRAGQTVVDVGCGIGGPSCDIAETTGCHVVGVTNSQPGVAGAEQVAKARGLATRVRFQHGDMVQLPFPNDSFDGVFSCEAVHNVQDKPSLARELARVATRGAAIVVGDLFLLRPANQITISAEQLKSFSFHLFEADEWISMLQEHGVEVTESVNVGHHVGRRSLEHCIATCRDRAAIATPGSLEHTILTRTVEATRLLSDGFRSGDLGWGIWTALKK